MTSCKSVSHATCIEYYNYDAFFYFFEQGHSIDEKNLYSKTSLVEACQIGYLELVQFLVEQGANLEISDCNMLASINYACQHGYFDLVKYLIEKGANQNHSSGYGPAITCASHNDHFEIIKYLLENGSNIESKDKATRPPFDLACDHNNFPIIQYLFEKGSNIESKTFKGPLFTLLAVMGNLTLISFLLIRVLIFM